MEPTVTNFRGLYFINFNLFSIIELILIVVIVVFLVKIIYKKIKNKK